MKNNLLLIAFATAFTSGEIKTAAESDAQALAANWVDEALLNWPVTVDQLRAHPTYQEESEREHLSSKKSFTRANERLLHLLQHDKLARAQANCDFISQAPYPIAPSRAETHQKSIDCKLQMHIEYRAKIARRTKLTPQFTDIRKSKEYEDTLTRTQDRTNRAKTSGTLIPTLHSTTIWEQANLYIRENQCEQAQALIDFLFTFKYPCTPRGKNMYLKTLNEAQQKNNKALKIRPPVAE